MSPPRTVLLTGGTGFLGTLIARRLLDEGWRTFVLVRAEDDGEAAARLRRAWWEWPELVEAIGNDMVPVAGDVRRPSLGLGREDLLRIEREADMLINSAADLRLGADLGELRRTNVEGVRNLLGLADRIHRDRGVHRFVHVSTAYVCGKARGEVSEGAMGTEFASNYERSKAEGEALVQGSALPWTVFRPVMVVGERERGWIRTFNTLYYPLRLYLSGRLRALPIDPQAKVNMVPGDMAADAIVRIAGDPRGSGRTVHLVPPSDQLPTVRELMDAVRDWAASELEVRLPKGVFLNLPGKGLLVRAAGGLAEGLGREGDMRPLLSYLEQGQTFRRDGMEDLVGPCDYDWKAHLQRMLSFGTRYGFMHRTERTVHEQMLFRLGRERRRVRLFDIAEGKVSERDARAVAEDATRAARALVSLGVGKGDRVAVVGLNSVRYLIAEAAIGLCGAVSVPLYYTSPVPEVKAILQDSGAKALLIGAPRFSGLAKELPGMVCVSFMRQGAAEGAMGWEEFLGRGSECALPLMEPRDLATIRYTSGTTGRPQGVAFDQGNLRWMAENIASLPPWRARNREVRYLSFLPMNHVVEGILGTYSPYFAPAPLELYFLEDFRSLPEALPKVRPSVFFSVPRFYEKLWERSEGSLVGRLRIGQPTSRAGRSWNRWLGRMLLRRAGLDRCDQLIVGSAPCGEELLRSLRSLGIEVHNAYGLTEAPLLTLNRVGRNRIGTVGEPLPDTQVRISDSGEVEARGGQVMRGYHPLRPGAELDWLRTGDLGRITGEGSLVIEGRIKEVMISSYGKNIMPAKVEASLKQVPGVVEAMLIADHRPFATALLWVEGMGDGGSEQLDREVLGAGEGLSEPERPKAWAVLPYDLDIEKGEMTANLKIRRKVLMERHADLISSLYDGSPPPGYVLHMGRRGKG